MGRASPAFDVHHPLLTDRARLDEILDVMYAKIQKTLFPWSPKLPRRRTGSQHTADREERLLEQTAVSADDVLWEALEALLRYEPERVVGTWKGLAVTIARNKAVDALRASEKSLRSTDHRHALRLVSGDAEEETKEGQKKSTLLDSLPSDWPDPETEFLVTQEVLRLRNLALATLSSRDRNIFFDIHFGSCSRKEVGDKLGLTGQRVGQIYNNAVKMLEDQPDSPLNPTTITHRPATRRQR